MLISLPFEPYGDAHGESSTPIVQSDPNRKVDRGGGEWRNNFHLPVEGEGPAPRVAEKAWQHPATRAGEPGEGGACV